MAKKMFSFVFDVFFCFSNSDCAKHTKKSLTMAEKANG